MTPWGELSSSSQLILMCFSPRIEMIKETKRGMAREAENDEEQEYSFYFEKESFHQSNSWGSQIETDSIQCWNIMMMKKQEECKPENTSQLCESISPNLDFSTRLSLVFPLFFPLLLSSTQNWSTWLSFPDFKFSACRFPVDVESNWTFVRSTAIYECYDRRSEERLCQIIKATKGSN